MRTKAIFVYLMLLVSVAFAQKNPTDSLKQLLNQSMPDTSRVLILDQLGRSLMYSDPIVAMEYAQEGLSLAEKSKFLRGESRILNRMGSILRITGNYPKALKMHLTSLQIAKDDNDLDGMAKTYNNMGILYSEQKESKKAIEYYLQTKAIAEKIKDKGLTEISLINIGSDYAILNQLDSARKYIQMAHKMAAEQNSPNVNYLLISLGNLFYRMGNHNLSLDYYHSSLPYLKKIRDDRLLSQTYFEMAQVFNKKNQRDSSIFYAKKSLQLAEQINHVKYVYEASMLLSSLYESSDTYNAYCYFKMATAAKDSLFNQEKVKQVQNLSFNEQLRQQEVVATQKEFENRQRLYLLLIVIGVVLLVAAILYRNNRHKQRANNLLHRQKEEIHLERDKAEKALSDLQFAQSQLIQKEKLASLGELTAGIAHEIQNPLNFVNNFSEVSKELVEELEEERNREERDEDFEKEILSDIKLNLDKINQHGNRASSIIKSMLEHSRVSKGERAMTDINKLVDEYLRLSYHGMTAKNKMDSAYHSVDYEFIADENLPIISAVPQDIGRVLLNLFNNAFYAVSEEGKKRTAQGLKNSEYQPKVTITTALIPPDRGGLGAIQIKVQDNGTGMNKETQAKIFQPFFSTKPSGEGTGLGLSLSYDIITQGHGGMIDVESVEGEGTTIIVRLPFQTN